jgi:putative ATP-dependent endonuclease of OLD family
MERFEPERILILRRDAAAQVTGKRVLLGAGIKAKTYRRYVRRGLAEAMLGRGVIVAEGLTEQLALHAVAAKMEAADPAR